MTDNALSGTLKHTAPVPSYNNNNNDNKHDNVYGAVIMAEPLQEFTRSFDECRMAPSGRRPKTKPDDLGCESACVDMLVTRGQTMNRKAAMDE